MEQNTNGIIIRLHPLTETSLIVHWLSAECGRIATVAKGARRPTSPFSGKLDLFFVSDFTFRRSRRSDLHTLCELQLLHNPAFLRTDLDYLQQYSYCVKLIEQSTEVETPIPEIYQLAIDMLKFLEDAGPAARNILLFEIKLLSELGLAPRITSAGLSAIAVSILNKMLHCDWQEAHEIALTTQALHEIDRFLSQFIVYHLNRIPKDRPKALLMEA
jgi:DNA repair protein RecO (recombination protein O)